MKIWQVTNLYLQKSIKQSEFVPNLWIHVFYTLFWCYLSTSEHMRFTVWTNKHYSKCNQLRCKSNSLNQRHDIIEAKFQVPKALFLSRQYLSSMIVFIFIEIFSNGIQSLIFASKMCMPARVFRGAIQIVTHTRKFYIRNINKSNKNGKTISFEWIDGTNKSLDDISP